MSRPLRSERSRAVVGLAIDAGDPGRMARARRLHRSRAVTGLVVRPRSLESVVYGSLPEPYDVEIDVVGGASLEYESSSDVTMPAAASLRARCTCADLTEVCKHVLATLLALAEEVEAAPSLLDEFLGETAALDDPDDLDSSPFFTGPWVRPRSALRLERYHLPEPSPMVVDGVDAWPILDSAIVQASAEISRRRGR